ncbi:MAG: chemotaxis protein CheC [Crinalium sp.]
MLITEQQQDALTEFINIAFARTASSLSDLVGERVILEVPKVSIHPLTALPNEFSSFFPGEVATIHQIFTGSVSGDALLLLDYQSAAQLTNLLTANREAQTDNLDITASEVLLEVGNILLNACLGMLGNLLEMQVAFAVPRLHLEVLYGLLNSLTIQNRGLRYGLVIGTAFKLQNSPVSGYLVIVLGVGSLNCLIRAINTWADLEI